MRPSGVPRITGEERWERIRDRSAAHLVESGTLHLCAWLRDFALPLLVADVPGAAVHAAMLSRAGVEVRPGSRRTERI